MLYAIHILQVFFLCENLSHQPIVCGLESIEVIVKEQTCKKILKKASKFTDDYIALDEIGDYGRADGSNEDNDDEVDKMLEELLMDGLD